LGCYHANQEVDSLVHIEVVTAAVEVPVAASIAAKPFAFTVVAFVVAWERSESAWSTGTVASTTTIIANAVAVSPGVMLELTIKSEASNEALAFTSASKVPITATTDTSTITIEAVTVGVRPELDPV
jgi:hypothetical protein